MSGEIRIGMLTPHAAAGPEAEFPAMAPGRVLTCVARVSADAPAVGGGADPTTPSALRELTAPPLLDEAAELLARGSVDAIGYASTSSGSAIGFDAETTLVRRLSRRVGVPVVATCAAAVLALRVLDVERIALVDPPWFDAELNELGDAYFQSAHVESSAALEPSSTGGRDVRGQRPRPPVLAQTPGADPGPGRSSLPKSCVNGQRRG
jgi:maleate isomerase